MYRMLLTVAIETSVLRTRGGILESPRSQRTRSEGRSIEPVSPDQGNSIAEHGSRDLKIQMFIVRFKCTRGILITV